MWDLHVVEGEYGKEKEEKPLTQEKSEKKQNLCIQSKKICIRFESQFKFNQSEKRKLVSSVVFMSLYKTENVRAC